jgi:hypothetical protein
MTQDAGAHSCFYYNYQKCAIQMTRPLLLALILFIIVSSLYDSNVRRSRHLTRCSMRSMRSMRGGFIHDVQDETGL